MTFCENCGSEISGNFCPKCGQPIKHPVQQQSAPPMASPVNQAPPTQTSTQPYQQPPPQYPSQKTNWIIPAIVILVIAIVIISFAFIISPFDMNGEESANGKDKKDSDNDGVNDDDDIDDDNDGVPDTDDFAQFRNAKIIITIEGCEVQDQVDAFDYSGEVYFNIGVGSTNYRVPDEGKIYAITVGDYKNIDVSFTVDVDDDVANYDVTFNMWEDDGGLGNDQLDIYGGSESGRGVKYTLNIADQDDFYASLDGSEDGTENTDDDDAILDIRIQVI